MSERIIGIIQEVFLWIDDQAKLSISGKIVGLFNMMMGGMNSGLALAFSNPIIVAFLTLASYMSWAIFFIFLIYYFLKISREERRNWYVITMTPINAILFIAFNQIISKVCFLVPNMVIEGLSNVISVDVKSWGILEIGKAQASLLLCLALLIAAIGFLIVSLLRLGGVFIQMLIAPFYVPSLLAGDTQKVSEWLHSTVAVGFTYLVQYIVFYSGVLLLTYGDDMPPIIPGGDIASYLFGFVFMISTFMVPKALQKWGWSTGATHTFQSAYMGINAVASGLKTMLK